MDKKTLISEEYLAIVVELQRNLEECRRIAQKRLDIIVERDNLIEKLREKLDRYRAAEEKRELVFLPIPIGDPVFVVSYEYSGVFGKYYSISEKPFGTDMLPNVGKTVFRTLDDAVQAMDKLYKVLNGGK